jgi:hypothetical protein
MVIMIQSRSFKFSRASMVLTSIALLLVTLLTTAMVSRPSVKEVLSDSCDVPFMLSVSGSNVDEIGTEIDARLANELVAAKCAVDELLSGAVLLGIAQDFRLAQELVAVKGALEELASAADLGIAQDIRLAQELVSAKGAVEELASAADLGIAQDSRLALELVGAKVAAEELILEATSVIAAQNSD